MTVDRSLVLARVAIIRANLTELEQIRQEGKAAFQGSARTIAASRYLLQTSLEAMADIGNHIIARQGWGVPTSYQATMELLAGKGVVAPSKLEVYRRMMRFRNLVVHLYHQVDDVAVWEIIADHLEDYRDFLADIIGYLDRLDA